MPSVHIKLKLFSLFDSNMKGSKSSALWNALDPDDPYDIKKSMIARLPDHPSRPMAQHLELVCLMQAAEIERLTDYLTQIKSKYREMERRELDRHSYEVQIKQLAQKNISVSNLQKENERLKDFIRRQGMQLEELQKKSLASVNLEVVQAKYEGVLNQLRIARAQNENAEKAIGKLNVEVGQWRGRWERVNLEIQSVGNQRDQFVREVRLLQEKNKSKGNIEQAINDRNRQIQRLNTLLSQKTIRLEQATSSAHKMSGELNVIQERYRNAQRQREKMVITLKQLESMKLRNDTVEKMEEKVAMMSMEIERLNGLNAIRARQLAEAHAQIQRFKFQLRNTQGSKEQLQRERQRVSNLQAEIQMLRVGQNRIKIIADQLQRVRLTLNSKNQQLYHLQQRLSSAQTTTNIEVTSLNKQKVRLEQELQLSQQKIDSMKNTINSNQTNALQLARLAKERSSLEQQLQAARAELRNYRNITENQLNTLKNENQMLKKDIQHGVSRAEYEKYRVQTDRLRAQIQRIRNQSMNLRRILEQQKTTTIKIQNQRNNLISENQSTLNQLLLLKKEIQDLKLMAKTFVQKQRQMEAKHFQIMNLERINHSLGLQIQDSKSRNQKLQSSIQSIYKQLQRLHAVLSAKVNDNQKLMRDIAQYEQKCRFYQSKLGNSANQREFYQKQASKLRLQIENTTKLSHETSRDLMNRINDLLLQKEKNDKAIVQKDKILGEYAKEKENLQRKLVEVQRDIAVKISFQEQLKRQKEQLRIQREKYYEEARINDTTISQLQSVIREKQNIGKQSQGKAKVWQSRVTEWQSRLKDAQRGLQIRDQQADRYKRQIERLNSQIQRFTQDVQEIVRQRDAIKNQNNQLKRRIEELMKEEKSRFAEEQLRNQLKMAQEALFRERKQAQNLRNNLRVFEQNLNRQNKEFQSLREQVKEYQMKIVHIQTTQTRVLDERIKDYQKKLQERDNLIITLQRQTKQMQVQLGSVVSRDQQSLNNLRRYQEKISLLSVQIERLNVKLQEKSRQYRDRDEFIQNMPKPGIDKDTLDRLKQYQAKLNFYASELDKLKSILTDKDRQIAEKDNAIQSLTTKISQTGSIPVQQSQALSRYKIQITNLKTALDEFQNINMHTVAERDELFKVSHQIKEQLDQVIFRSSQQEKHLRGELNYRLEENHKFGEELGSLKKKEQTLLLKIQEYERIINNKADERALRGRTAELQNQIHLYSREISELRIQNTNIRQQVNQLLIINQQLNVKLGQSSNYSRDQFSRITSKVKELTLIIQSKDEEVIEWDQKYNTLYAAYQQLYHNYQITKTEYDVTLANIKSYQAKLFKIGDDYEALALVLRNKEQQIYDLKMRFKSDGDLYQKNLVLSKQIDRLTQINRKLQAQISQLRLNLSDSVSLQKRLQEQLSLLVVLFAEIQSLRSRLISSENECEQVRRSSIAPFRVDRRQ